jgi:hypothetical protein
MKNNYKLMKKLAISFLLTGMVLGSFGETFAQNQSKGEVADQEFVIRKDRVLTVPTQPRIFEKLPVLPQPKGLSDFKYSVSPFTLNLPRLALVPTPILKNYTPPKIDLFPGFVRAGYGTFNSPLLELRFMSTESTDLSYALQFNHESFGKGPVAEEQSSQFRNHVGADLSYFGEQAEIYGSLNWNQDMYSIYGVDSSLFEDPEFETSSNTLNTIQFKAGVREIQKTGMFTYDGELNFRNFKDSFLANENEIGTKASFKFRPTDEWSIKLGASYFSTNTEDFNFLQTRSFGSLKPELAYKYDQFKISAGVNLVYENDVWENKPSDLWVFPVVEMQYQFAKEFGFFGKYSGDVERKNYFSFVQENPFLGPSNQLFNTVNTSHIEAGIAGQFQEIFHYRAGVNLDQYDQLHFFVNSISDSSRFELIYDQEVTVLNFNAELGFKLSDLYTLGTRLDLYQYELKMQPEAWHRPTWELKINNQFKPMQKLLIQANINLMGGLKARGQRSQVGIAPDIVDYFPVTTLQTIVDLQLKADYKITNQFSVFAEGNNLANGMNTRWQHYPVRGTQVRGGLSFKF